MLTPLKLESLDALPAALRSRLEPHRRLFRRHEYLEDVLANSGVRSVAEDLEAFLRAQCIHAYHCTKEPSDGYFAARGLRLTDVQVHQAEFLRAHGSHFTAQEVVDMEAAWQRHFVEGGQLRMRNGRVWACLSRTLVKSPGADVFFKYLGGEAIFMPLKRHPTIEPKLAKLGRPVIVEFGLPGAEAWYFLGMAKYVLSRYHQSIRADAHVYDVETSSRIAVHPRDIVSVTRLEDFLP